MRPQLSSQLCRSVWQVLKLVAEIRDLGAQFDDAKKKLIGDEKLSPQEARGAKRFALAAMGSQLCYELDNHLTHPVTKT
jgi:hypothetical protein